MTGGAGYIGSHFCKLASRKYDLVVLDDLSNGHEEFVRWCPLEKMDIRDTRRVQALLSVFRPQAVVHFAGKILVPESVEKPDLYQSVNVEGTKSLLTAMKNVGVPQILFSSTAAVYGIPKVVPIPESHERKPVNPYGENKRDVEDILMLGAEKIGLEVGVLRYFNVAGESPDGDLWEDHTPETHVVPNLLRAIRERRPFFLHGTDYPTRDGTCVRDYVDVMDLANAHLVALEKLGRMPFISNVGSGAGVSVRELLRAAETVTGEAIQVTEGPRRAGDPPELVADAKFFKTWYAEGLTPLEQSLRRVWERF